MWSKSARRKARGFTESWKAEPANPHVALSSGAAEARVRGHEALLLVGFGSRSARTEGVMVGVPVSVAPREGMGRRRRLQKQDPRRGFTLRRDPHGPIDGHLATALVLATSRALCRGDWNAGAARWQRTAGDAGRNGHASKLLTGFSPSTWPADGPPEPRIDRSMIVLATYRVSAGRPPGLLIVECRSPSVHPPAAPVVMPHNH
jgi:hypothetical protein